MAGVNGKVAFVAPNGAMFLYAPEDTAEAESLGYRAATDEEFARRTAEREREAQYGTAGQQALGMLEKAGEAATFGLLPDLSGASERKAELERQSPFLALGAEAAGVAVPTLASGGAAGAIGGAGRAARAAGVLAEGLAGGAAGEAERIRHTEEDFSGVNMLMFGVGGELLGRALPLALRGGLGQLDNVLARAERRAVTTDAASARSMPPGPERAAAFERASAEIKTAAAEEIATVAPKVETELVDLADLSKAGARLNALVPETAPIHADWAERTLQRIDEEVAKARELQTVRFADDAAPRPRSEVPGKSEAAERVLAEIRAKLPPGAEEKAAERLYIPQRKTLETRRTAKPLSPEKFAKRYKLSEQQTAVLRAMGPDEAAEYMANHRFLFNADMTAPERATYEALEPNERAVFRDTYKRSNLEQEAAIGRRTPFTEATGRQGQRPSNWTDDFRVSPDPMPPGAQKVLDRLNKALEGSTVGERPEAKDMLLAAQRAYRELGSYGQGVEPIRNILREGIEDGSLFGQAAEVAAAVNRADAGTLSEAALRGAGAESALSGGEALLDAAKRFGLRDAGELAGLERDVSALRQAVTDSAEADAAGALRGAGDAPPALAGVPQELVSRVGDVAGSWAKRAAQGAGAAAGAATGVPGAEVIGAWAAGAAIDRVLGAMKTGQAAAVAATARRFVRRGTRALERAPKATVPASVTILSRFAGDYPTPEASYQAKAEALRAAAAQPSLLPQILAASFGDLPTTHPGAFRAATGQATAAFRYLVDNLPPATAASLLSPRGLPPSKQAIRDFAVLWTAVTEPESVLEALSDGTASPLQIDALKAAHPALYTSLRTGVVAEIGKAPESLSTQTKVWLDLLFDLDGAAGLAYSLEAGRLFRELPPQQRQPGGNPTLQRESINEPRGIAAAKHGPTMG